MMHIRTNDELRIIIILSPTGYTVCRDLRRYQPNVKKKCRFLLMITTGNGLAPFQLHKMSYFFSQHTAHSLVIFTIDKTAQRSAVHKEVWVDSNQRKVS